MKRNNLIIATLTFVISLSASIASGQSDSGASKISYKLGTDLVSSYIWRGTVGDPSPSIQPTLALVAGGFEAGVWGSANFKGTYKEFDPYISFTAKSLKFTLTDYNWLFTNSSYFNYKNDETDHVLEGSVSYTGPESFPVSVSVNTMFYGADKKYSSDEEEPSTKQNYSTYIEVAYPVGNSSLFLGMTPSNGYYGAGYGKVDGFAIVNLGISTSKTIKLSSEFELPVKGSVYLNPQSESVHFVIGISL